MKTHERVEALAKNIALLEGKKSQVAIGDIREILKIIAKMESENTGFFSSPLEILKEYAGKIREGNG